jgi:hypothetical protein
MRLHVRLPFYLRGLPLSFDLHPPLTAILLGDLSTAGWTDNCPFRRL